MSKGDNLSGARLTVFLTLPTLRVWLLEDDLASQHPGQWEEVTRRGGREEIQLLPLPFHLNLRADDKEVHRVLLPLLPYFQLPRLLHLCLYAKSTLYLCLHFRDENIEAPEGGKTYPRANIKEGQSCLYDR